MAPIIVLVVALLVLGLKRLPDGEPAAARKS
jgi:Sec-independent protein translocase protein TatA